MGVLRSSDTSITTRRNVHGLGWQTRVITRQSLCNAKTRSAILGPVAPKRLKLVVQILDIDFEFIAICSTGSSMMECGAERVVDSIETGMMQQWSSHPAH